MEEPLKARLIGATVLVVLAVVVVPELLSGPKQSPTGQAAAQGSRGTRTYTIDLGGAASAGAKLQPRADDPSVQTTPALPPVESPTARSSGQAPATPVDGPATPADAGPDASKAVSPPGPAVVIDPPAPAPVAEPGPSAPAAKSPAASRGGFSVQVGAFGSEATAQKLVGQLQAAGFPAYVSPMARSGKTLHRVRVGPAAGRTEADQLAARLKARGLPVSVVTGG